MNFYNVSIDYGKNKKFAEGVSIGEYPKRRIDCQSCGRRWTKDFLDISEGENSLTLALSNKNFPDFLSYGNHFLVNQKVADIFTEASLKDYSLKKMIVKSAEELTDQEKEHLRKEDFTSAEVKKIATSPIDYFLLIVRGKAKLDLKKSEIVSVYCPDCDSWHNRTKGENPTDTTRPQYLDLDTWDGSELFKIDIYLYRLFCTEKFHETYNENHLTGLVFKQILI